MELKKSDIVSFVKEIQSKAIDSIQEKYQPRIDKAKAAMLKMYDSLIEDRAQASISVKSSYSALIYKIDEDIAAGKITENTSGAGYYGYKTIASYFKEVMGFNLEDIKASSRSDSERFISDKIMTLELRDIKEELQQEKQKTEQAYKAVLKQISKIKTAEKCLSYLESLGFDISKIKPVEPELPAKVEKDALFPCLRETPKKPVKKAKKSA